MRASSVVVASLFLSGCLGLDAAGPFTPVARGEDRSGGQAAAAYLVLELPSKRVLAESRPDVLAAGIEPGSIIKIATLIAALEKGVVTQDTRVACRRAMTIDGRRFTCVHPDLHRPLDAREALGYSCNTFFAAAASRLPRAALDEVLVRMGLRPSSGEVPTALVAVGVAGVRATPRSLLNAFVRVTGPPSSFRMSETIRATVTSGLRLAATTGTASALGKAGIPALAKTGTALTAGEGVHGLVVAVTPDVAPTRAIVVCVAGGAGSDAAAVAADVLARSGVGQLKPAVAARDVRVGVARRTGGHGTVSLPLETYVARVVSGEAPPGAPAAALEALAITVRSFAMANRGRHGAEGFDFCDLTHCQVLGRMTPAAERAASNTRGLVLWAGRQVASVYYSASCGGFTEAPSHVWPGASDAAYLPARPDAACASTPSWTSGIAEPQLRRVLEAAGLRGAEVRGFAIASRHPSGRVAAIRVAGMVPDRIDASAFQLAAGRTLGWQAVKSTLFDVRRSSVGFVLAGRGVGHGVGLCVVGAAARAAQGRSRSEILSAYFPGLQVADMAGAGGSARPPSTKPIEAIIRVHLPEADRDRLDEVRSLVRQHARALASELGAVLPPQLDLRFHATIEAYTRATGQPWWSSARTAEARIDLLPLGMLQTRGILDVTLRHELVHVLTDPVLHDRPLWVREGLAVVRAGELAAGSAARGSGPGERRIGGPRAEGCPADADFRKATTPDGWRAVYQAAGQCVDRALAAGGRWQDLR